MTEKYPCNLNWTTPNSCDEKYCLKLFEIESWNILVTSGDTPYAETRRPSSCRLSLALLLLTRFDFMNMASSESAPSNTKAKIVKPISSRDPNPIVNHSSRHLYEIWDSFSEPAQLHPFPRDIALIKFIRPLGQGAHSTVFEVHVGSKKYSLKLVRGHTS